MYVSILLLLFYVAGTGGTPSDLFTCQNGFTLPARDQCDFENDCIDGSDELGCGMCNMSDLFQ